MPLAFRCFTLCSLCAQPAVVTVQSEHFNSLSALLCLYRPTEGCCPPLSCVSLHKGYWTCWMWWGRKGNKGGKKSLEQSGPHCSESSREQRRAKYKTQWFYTDLCTNNSKASVVSRRKITCNGQQSHCYLCIYKNWNYPFARGHSN